MPLGEFVIVLDNPSMSYFPGQMVTGRVVINANSEKKSQGLKIKFEGKATVHWTENETKRVGTGDDKREETITKSFDDSETFFEFKNYLLGDGRSDVSIPAGQSNYQFTFQLPPMNLPSSFVGQYGKVEYTLEANVNRSWKFDYNAKQCITVNSIVDLNNDLEATKPFEIKSSKTFCCLCCASGPLSLLIRAKTKGFVPGEIIPLEVEVNNLSNRRINSVSAKLVQEATFYAIGSKKVQPQMILKESGLGEGVEGGDSDIWRSELLIPPIPPTKLGGCRVIDVQYSLEIEAQVKGLALNAKEKSNIIIGTVPLRTNFEQLRVPESTPSPSAPPMFTPNGYPDLPPPQYQDSFNFKTEEKPANIVENLTNTVIDNIAPPEADFVPKYPTYGWKFPLPAPV